jgi:hypothetical protein
MLLAANRITSIDFGVHLHRFRRLALHRFFHSVVVAVVPCASADLLFVMAGLYRFAVVATIDSWGLVVGAAAHAELTRALRNERVQARRVAAMLMRRTAPRVGYRCAWVRRRASVSSLELLLERWVLAPQQCFPSRRKMMVKTGWELRIHRGAAHHPFQSARFLMSSIRCQHGERWATMGAEVGGEKVLVRVILTVRTPAIMTTETSTLETFAISLAIEASKNAVAGYRCKKSFALTVTNCA